MPQGRLRVGTLIAAWPGRWHFLLQLCVPAGGRDWEEAQLLSESHGASAGGLAGRPAATLGLFPWRFAAKLPRRNPGEGSPSLAVKLRVDNISESVGCASSYF